MSGTKQCKSQVEDRLLLAEEMAKHPYFSKMKENWDEIVNDPSLHVANDQSIPNAIPVEERWRGTVFDGGSDVQSLFPAEKTGASADVGFVYDPESKSFGVLFSHDASMNDPGLQGAVNEVIENAMKAQQRQEFAKLAQKMGGDVTVVHQEVNGLPSGVNVPAEFANAKVFKSEIVTTERSLASKGYHVVVR